MKRWALGDVTFMAAIGAFLGWPAVIFSFVMSCFVGSFVGCTLIILNRKDWASRIAHVPYIAAGAVICIFGGLQMAAAYLAGAFVDGVKAGGGRQMHRAKGRPN